MIRQESQIKMDIAVDHRHKQNGDENSNKFRSVEICKFDDKDSDEVVDEDARWVMSDLFLFCYRIESFLFFFFQFIYKHLFWNYTFKASRQLY